MEVSCLQITMPRKIVEFPEEILLHIFSSFDGPNVEPPSISVGDSSPWAEALRAKKAIVLVCRGWWRLEIPLLYKNSVFLHRVGQLSALVRTLRASSLRSADGGGYGQWVNRVHCELFVPYIWETIFRTGLKQLFEFCPNVRSVVHRPHWGPTASFQRSTLLSTLEKPIRHLVELTINEEILGTATFHSCHLTSFNTLTRLSLAIDAWEYQPYPEAMAYEVVLPHLHTLVCDVPSYEAYSNLDIISLHWTLPRLRHLIVTFSWSWWPTLENVSNLHLLNLARSFGAKLESLDFDNCATRGMLEDGLAEVVLTCPSLRRLTCPFDTIPVLQLPFPHATLRRVELFGPTLFEQVLGPNIQEHLYLLDDRETFPVLEEVVLLDPRLRGEAVDLAMLDEAYGTVLVEWMVKFKESKIRFVNCSGHPILLFKADTVNDRVENGDRSSVSSSSTLEELKDARQPDETLFEDESSSSEWEDESDSDDLSLESSLSTLEDLEDAQRPDDTSSEDGNFSSDWEDESDSESSSGWDTESAGMSDLTSTQIGHDEALSIFERTLAV